MNVPLLELKFPAYQNLKIAVHSFSPWQKEDIKDIKCNSYEAFYIHWNTIVTTTVPSSVKHQS